MNKKSKYGDDVCRYHDIKDSVSVYYVRACEKGKFCQDVGNDGLLNSYFSLCQDVPAPVEGISTLNGECSSDFDCEFNLECVSQKCIKTCSTAGYVPYKHDGDNTYLCGNPAPEGYCTNTEYPVDSTTGLPTTKYGSPKHKYQKCGLYTFHHLGNNVYTLKDIKYAHIGSVDNGEYVKTPKLCKSGFALPFYPNNNLQDPSTSGNNIMYYRCVTPVSIDTTDKRSSSCVIYYKEKDTDTEIKKYNVDQLQIENLSGDIGSYSNLCDFSNIELQISQQKFKEYSNTITDEQREKCGDLDNDKNSCDNNELIKLWYFSKNPEDYILYNGREKLEPVLNYLIQTEYHSYEFTRLININYLFLLLFLFFL